MGQVPPAIRKVARNSEDGLSAAKTHPALYSRRFPPVSRLARLTWRRLRESGGSMSTGLCSSVQAFALTQARLHRGRAHVEALSGKTAQSKQSVLRSAGAYLTRFELPA